MDWSIIIGIGTKNHDSWISRFNFNQPLSPSYLTSCGEKTVARLERRPSVKRGRKKDYRCSAMVIAAKLIQFS